MEDEINTLGSVETKEKRVAIGISESTKAILTELRSIYMIGDWDSAVMFLVENMKKVQRPKSEYFD